MPGTDRTKRTVEIKMKDKTSLLYKSFSKTLFVRKSVGASEA